MTQLTQAVRPRPAHRPAAVTRREPSRRTTTRRPPGPSFSPAPSFPPTTVGPGPAPAHAPSPAPVTRPSSPRGLPPSVRPSTAPGTTAVAATRRSVSDTSGEDVRAAIAGPGRPLPPALRAEMAAGFGRDVGHVRVHEGPLAERAATALDARAFTLGPHVVFGSGQYRPDTPAGRGLLAHELAHTLQTRDGAAARVAVADDPRLEEEADRAVRALAAGGAAVLDPHPGPALVRRAPTTGAPPPPVPATAPGTSAAPKTAPAQPGTTAPPALRLPPGLTVVTDEPTGLGTTELVVELAQFTLPLEKGAGPWVQKAYDAAAGGRLVFTPLFEGNSPAGHSSVAAFKEGGEKYKDVWLGAYGFASTKKLADAVTAAAATNDTVRTKLADPAVKNVVTGLGKGLAAAQCDVDHIVEKQLGGTSIPSNLQLLTSSKNQASGRETYQALVEVVRQIRDPSMRGPNVRRLQLRIAKAIVPSGQPDASFEIENLLRTGAVRGSDAEKAKAEGKPVALSAGGQGETVLLRDTGETALDTLSRRIVPGMRIETYKRAAGGAKSGKDTVAGALDSRAIAATGAGSVITLGAELLPGTAPAPAAPAGAEASPDPTAAPPGEARKLTLDKAKNSKIKFFYPYLSPGELTKLALDDQGNLTGEGVLHSSVPFLGKLHVVYTKDELKLVAPIPAQKLVSPLPAAFRFTGGELALQLSPSLVPSGTLTFSVGPAAKPILLGTLDVTVANGAFVASGELVPAGTIPGISAASGRVVWNSDDGWSGKLTAASASIPHSTADVEIGFTTTKDGRLDPYATGAILTSVRNTQLRLGARWDGRGLTYTGSVRLEKPLPLVDSVKLSGRYGERGLYLAGDADIVWKQLKATMKVEYTRADGDEEGRFSGSATVVVKTEKADGSLNLSFDEQGRYWGKGSVAYQVTKDLRPVLGVEITKDRRIKLAGSVAVADIVLARKWPSADGGTVPIIKGIGVKFPFPTPIPAVTAFIELRGSLQLVYGVGPVVLRAVLFAGELYPFEEDLQVAAKLSGAFVVPAYAELRGTFGAYIGAELAGGAAGVKGGIDITPSLRIQGEGGVRFAADYDKDGFSFDAVAYAQGQLIAAAKVFLVAEVYALYGLLEHRWSYEAASVSARIGPEIRLTLGRIAYAKNGEITWPSLGQIKVEPESVDPTAVVRDMLGLGKAVES
jgi:Domain of unknown function (DUF4157)